MKKCFSFCLILAVLLVCAAGPVSALDMQTPARLPLSERSERPAMRQERLAFRKLVLEKHLELMELMVAGNEMHLELMEKLEASRGSLSRETAEALRATHRQIRILIDSVKETKGDIRDLHRRLRTLKPRQDLAAMKAVYADMLAVIEARIAAAQLINERLLYALELDFGS